MTEMKEKIYPALPVIRESPSAPDIELSEIKNEEAHLYRLKVITDVQKYLEEEITRRENFSKKYFRISRVINSVDSVLISISLGAGITGAVFVIYGCCCSGSFRIRNICRSYRINIIDRKRC